MKTKPKESSTERKIFTRSVYDGAGAGRGEAATVDIVKLARLRIFTHLLRPNPASCIMNLGIFLPNWIGDVAMATPCLRALRAQFPRPARLVAIHKPYVADVLAGTPWIDEYIPFDARAEGRFLGSWRLARTLRRQKLDAVVLLTNSISTALIAWASGARQRIGFARNGRGWLLTQGLDAPHEGGRFLPVSAVDYYLELARALGAGVASRQLELATTASDEQAATRVWEKLQLTNRPVVGLSTGGAYGAAKHWPSTSFAALARRMADETGHNVLVMCGPAERAAAAEIERLANHPLVTSLAGEGLSIGLTKACLRRVRLLVSNDSGPRHLAAGFGVPTVALFGPTDPRWSMNYNPRETPLQVELPCRPCARRTCPLEHHKCMRDLSVERVFTAAARLLEEKQARVA